MKRLYKITAVTLVTAIIFLMLCFSASASTVYGVYGQGGLTPPFSSRQLEQYICIFIPLAVTSSGEYEGVYLECPDDYECRVVYTWTENTSKKYNYYLQIRGNSSSRPTVYISDWISNGFTTWRHYYSGTYGYSPSSWVYDSSSSMYHGIIPVVSSDYCFIDNDGTFHSWVTDSEHYDDSLYSQSSVFTQSPGTGIPYFISYPLVSTENAWAYNYGYETEDQEQEAIDNSKFDYQNQIINEGFSRVEGAISNAANQIQQAITNAAGEIINAGSDMPTLDTNNEWMNDSLTKVNEWLSSLEEFDKQMDAAEEDNADNMANAKSFLDGFFNVLPKPLIAVLTLGLVMIVVVKVVGR